MHNVPHSHMNKRSLIVQDRIMNINVTKYKKFTDMISDSTLNPVFKKLPLEV